MAKDIPVWHGDLKESLDLVNALNSNCVCELGLMGVVKVKCASHRMLLEDQRALDGLLFIRRELLDRLNREEQTRGKR